MSISIKLDLMGHLYGRLTVVGEVASLRAKDGNPIRRWQCLCSCGALSVVRQSNLRSGHTTSCGCLHNEITAAMSRTHGRAKTPEHNSWVGIRKRCYNPTEQRYADYGGRGIIVCRRWLESFEAFFEDMGPKPSPSHSIDRIDNSGNYEPDNCRWATKREQANNRRPRGKNRNKVQA